MRARPTLRSFRFSPRLSSCVVALALVGCGGDDSSNGTTTPGDQPIPPTLTSIRKEVFEQSCAFQISCHGPGAKEAGLVLGRDATVTNADIHKALLGPASFDLGSPPKAFRVVPGDLENSHLWRKVERTLASAPCAKFLPNRPDNGAGGAGSGTVTCAADDVTCADADGKATCANPKTSAKHCGKCGNDCRGGACVEGVCTPPGASGAPCKTTVDCLASDGLACVMGACTPRLLVDVGEPCNETLSGGGSVFCKAGGACTSLMVATVNGKTIEERRCAPQKALGQACDASKEGCEGDARCLGGTCALPPHVCDY